MNIINWLFSRTPDPDYIQELRDFDLKKYESEIILSLPFETLEDVALTERIVERKLTEKIQSLFARVMMEKFKEAQNRK